jgi:hypothetical protein
MTRALGACSYDLIVAMDDGIRRELLAAAAHENPQDAGWYAAKVRQVE